MKEKYLILIILLMSFSYPNISHATEEDLYKGKTEGEWYLEGEGLFEERSNYVVNSLNYINKLQDSVECYENALYLDPENMFILLALGRSYLYLEECEKCLEYFTKFIELYPEEIQQIERVGYFLFSWDSTDAYETIVKFSDKVLEIYPKNGLFWGFKCDSLMRLEKYEEVIECCDKKLELYPLSRSALTRKAKALEKIGRYDEAEKCLHKLYVSGMGQGGD